MEFLKIDHPPKLRIDNGVTLSEVARNRNRYTTRVNSSEIKLASKQSNYTLFADNGGLIYEGVSQQLTDIFKILLKLIIGLTGAKFARLYFLTEHLKCKVVSNTSKKMNPMSKVLVKRCFKFASHLNLRKGSTVSDSEGKPLGVLNIPCLLYPLMVQGSEKAFGLVYLERSEDQSDFSIESVNTLFAFAQSTSRLFGQSFIHKENFRCVLDLTASIFLFAENAQAREIQLTNHKLITHMVKISNMINSNLPLDTMLQIIMNSAEIILRAESSSLMLVDELRNELYFNLASGDGAGSLKAIRVPIGEGIAGIVAKTQEPLLVNNAQTDSRVFKQADESTDFNTRNILATPMVFQGRLIGVLEVINSIGREKFSGRDLEIFSTFSDQAALAIQNREFVSSMKKTNQELNKKLGELSTLYEIGKVLTSTLNRADFFDAALAIMAEEIKVEYAAFLVKEKSKESFQVISQVGEHEQPTTEEIARLLVNEQNFPSKRLFLPMQQGGETYGYVYLMNKRDSSLFSDDDYRLITTVTNQITKVAQNFNLLDEMLKNEAYKNELKITSSFQKSLLPRKAIESSHCSIGFFSKSAKAMGGDFYDFFRVDQNKIVFVIADVSGKSLPAALFMAVTNSIVRTIGKLHSISTSEILNEANNLIYENSEAGMFVTLFYSVYNPRTHCFTYSSAGHNEQYLYRFAQKQFEVLQCKGHPLGVIPSKNSTDFDMKDVHVEAGDILVFYTDGVIEALNHKKEEFGTERLKQVISENYFLSPNQMAKRIYREMESFVGKQEQFDDVTIMIVKIL